MQHGSPSKANAGSVEPKIALIVDHPIRDLPGLVLTALSLCRRGVSCSLVPYNMASHELAYQAPDFVLLSHFRQFSVDLTQSLSQASIGLGVLDSEGGVLDSLEGFGGWLINDPSLRQEVACYCCWGPEVADYLVSAGYFGTDQVHVTGCPRTDFYDASLRDAAVSNAAAAERHSKNLILLNSNYCIGNPGIKSVDEQLRQMVELWGLDEQTARAWHDVERDGLRGLVEIANTLARRFPEATVVYRPHPFERLETYQDMFEPLGNLHCLREGSVDAWLHHAKVVIQRSCSTAIEAGMVGTTALSPDWLPASFERPAANEASAHCETMAELEDAVAKALAGTYEPTAEVAAHLEKIIGDWYFRVDGRAHERIADAILQAATSSPELRQEREAGSRRVAYKTRKHRPLRAKYWRGRLLSALGKPPGFSLRHWRAAPLRADKIDAWRDSAKYFSAEDVRRLATEVLACQRLVADCVDVRGARPDDYLFEYRQGTLVTLSPSGAWRSAGNPAD
jgi:surface carbohydrate biosynthesis protein